jgi:SAM-dependent methyltransferase
MTSEASESVQPATGAVGSSPDERFQRLYAQGPGDAVKKGSVLGRPFRRLMVFLTHPIRDHQREIDLTLLDASHESVAGTARTREVAAIARSEAAQATDVAAQATDVATQATDVAAQATVEAALAREEIGSVADVAASFHRRTEDLEARLAVAVSLNDELSLAVDSFRTDIEAGRSEAESGQGRLEEFKHDVVGSLDGLTAELSRATLTLAKEISDIRDELLRQRGVADNMEFIYRELTSKPFMTRPDGLRFEDVRGDQVMGFRAKWGSQAMYAGFEDVFRGDEAMIRDRQRGYVEVLRNSGPVVDLGAGRGEMLEVLADAGVEAIGVDLDPDMAERVRAKGLAMECLDAFEYLDKQPDGSIASIFSAQFIEHLTGERLISLIRLAYRKLAPGGLFVAETVNPHSPRALKAFWVDLTHAHPIFPEALVVWCGLAGFSEATVRFPLGVGDLDADLRTQGEYAVVACKTQ